MKITSIRSLGLRCTFSPEMRGPQHNYITAESGAVHRNSHAVSYCLIAFRCLWLKAHYAPEWWAAVMSFCHTDKLIRYMGVARSEGVQFDTLNLENLTTHFTVSGDVVHRGMIGIKKLGKKKAPLFEGTGTYTDIDDFIAQHTKDKIVLERFIKLGVFRKWHPNARATWMWYQYKYCSGKDITQLRAEIREQLLVQDGWNDKTIEAERKAYIARYQAQYPKRNKIPSNVVNWKPKPRDTRENVMALYPDDYNLSELLLFEQEFLGYYMHSPMELFRHTGKTITYAQRTSLDGGASRLECMILHKHVGLTKNNHTMCKLTVTDGVQSATVVMWEREYQKQDKRLLKVGCGVEVRVEYNPKHKSFTVVRGGCCARLLLRSEMLSESVAG